MPRVGLEPTTPVFERADTIHALYSVATVIGEYIRVGSMISFPMYLLWKQALRYSHLSVLLIQIRSQFCVTSRIPSKSALRN
jgi:hypothetical protein